MATIKVMDKKKILLVEDDIYTRDVYVEVLGDAGFEVISAQDGEEGLVKASQGGFDLILLDVVMPKLDGLGVLRNLSQKPPQSQNGPIILLTNLGHDPVIKEALSLGAKSYLIKSDLNPDQLVLAVKKFLG